MINITLDISPTDCKLNGESSDECVDPSHEYISAGVFKVALTVSGPGGNDTYTQTEYITVYTPVQVGFTASPTAGIAPLLVHFANHSTGDYDDCSWDFGDGGISDDCVAPSYEYALPGTFSVTLTISGPGGTDSQTMTGYIQTKHGIFIPYLAHEP